MSKAVINKEPGAWNHFPSVQIIAKISEKDNGVWNRSRSANRTGP